MQLPGQHSPRKTASGPFVAPSWPPSATFCLLVVLGVVALAQVVVRRTSAGGGDPLLEAGALTANGLREWRLWQPITSLFLSGRYPTAWLLPVVGLVLGLAGRSLEAVIGRRHLFQLFLVAGVGGGLAQLGLDEFVLGQDVTLFGASASAAALLWALAGITPRASLFPGLAALDKFKVMHGALGVGAGAVFGAEHPPCGGVLFGCLCGCLYMRVLGFGQRVERPQPAREHPLVDSASPPAHWANSPAASASPAIAQPLLLAPGITSASAQAATLPNFTDRERRMSAREFVTEQIDPILDKIRSQGLNSLSEEDRRLLAKACEKLSLGQ